MRKWWRDNRQEKYRYSWVDKEVQFKEKFLFLVEDKEEDGKDKVSKPQFDVVFQSCVYFSLETSIFLIPQLNYITFFGLHCRIEQLRYLFWPK